MNTGLYTLFATVQLVFVASVLRDEKRTLYDSTSRHELVHYFVSGRGRLGAAEREQTQEQTFHFLERLLLYCGGGENCDDGEDDLFYDGDGEVIVPVYCLLEKI